MARTAPYTTFHTLFPVIGPLQDLSVEGQNRWSSVHNRCLSQLSKIGGGSGQETALFSDARPFSLIGKWTRVESSPGYGSMKPGVLIGIEPMMVVGTPVGSTCNQDRSSPTIGGRSRLWLSVLE